MSESEFLEEPHLEFAIGKGFIPNRLAQNFKNKYYKLGPTFLS